MVRREVTLDILVGRWSKGRGEEAVEKEEENEDRRNYPEGDLNTGG